MKNQNQVSLITIEESTLYSKNLKNSQKGILTNQTVFSFLQSLLPNKVIVPQHQIQSAQSQKTEIENKYNSIDKTFKQIQIKQQIQSFKLIDMWPTIQKQFLQSQKFFSQQDNQIKRTFSVQKQIQTQQMDGYQVRKYTYDKYMKDYAINNIQDLWTQINRTNQKDKIFKIPNYVPQVEVLPRHFSENYDIIEYQVYLSYFKMTIILKNVLNKVTDVQNLIGAGSFGHIFKIKRNQKEFAAKRLYFIQGQRDQNLLECLREYSLYKLASFFEIGPKIQYIDNIDVICYDNAIQFYMQLCSSQYINKMKQIESDLKRNLSILHKLKIMHRDIKPPNILYSIQFNKFVFIDFGMSHPIKQQPNIKTMTGICGTLKYLPDWLQKRYKSNKKFVGLLDLYLLDTIALNKSIQQLSNQIIRQKMYINPKINNQKVKIANNAQQQKKNYLKSPQISKIYFQIRILGFTRQIQENIQKLIQQIKQENEKLELQIKIKKYVNQKVEKKQKKAVWLKKCQKISEYFINKGYQRIAKKLLLQRLNECLLNQQKYLKQLVSIYQNLIKFDIEFDLQKAKQYLIQVKKLCQKQNNFFVYEDLNIFLNIIQNKPSIEYQIYNFIIKYKSQKDIWRCLSKYAQQFAINQKLKTSQQILEIAIKIRQIVKQNYNMNEKQYLQQAQMYLELLMIYYIMHQLTKSIEQGTKGLNLLIQKYKQNHKNYPISWNFYNNIGFIKSQIGKLDESLEYLKLAQSIQQLNYGKSTYLSKTVDNIGQIYRLKGNFQLAVQYQTKALQIRKESAGQFTRTTAIVYKNIAWTVLQKGQLQVSLKNLELQSNIYQQIKLSNSKQMLQCKCELLYIHLKLENNQIISKLFSQILQLKKCIPQEKRSYIYYQRMRNYNLFQKNYQLCEKSFIKSFQIKQDNLLQEIELCIDQLEFYIHKNYLILNRDKLSKIQQLLQKIDGNQSYHAARYHYLYSILLLKDDLLQKCLIQINKSIILFGSYFEYHYDLIDCYLVLLQVKICKQKEINLQQIDLVKQRVDKILQFNNYHQNHSKVIEYKKIIQKLQK